jgi:hydrogenase expression/formation protein HypC
MCVATAGVVVSMDGDWAKVDVLGNRVSVHVGFVQPKIGDWVLVHAGYAMQVLTPEAAEELVALHEEIRGAL